MSSAVFEVEIEILKHPLRAFADRVVEMLGVEYRVCLSYTEHIRAPESRAHYGFAVFYRPTGAPAGDLVGEIVAHCDDTDFAKVVDAAREWLEVGMSLGGAS